MKFIILLSLISTIAIAQHPQDRIKEQNSYIDTAPRIESQNSITIKKLITKNCDSTTTRKDIETSDGTTYDSYTCNNNMLVYINYGDKVQFKVLYKQKNKKIIDLLSASSFEEVKNLKTFVLNQYKQSTEYQKQQEIINKKKAAQIARKEAHKKKLAIIEEERKIIIEKLLK